MLGRIELRVDQGAVDLSFTGAWRSWPHTTLFPQVDTDLMKSFDGARVMTSADE